MAIAWRLHPEAVLYDFEASIEDHLEKRRRRPRSDRI